MMGLISRISLYSAAFILTSLLMAQVMIVTTRYYVERTPKREDGWPLRFCSRLHPIDKNSDIETLDNIYCDERGYYVRGNECHMLIGPPTVF